MAASTRCTKPPTQAGSVQRSTATRSCSGIDPGGVAAGADGEEAALGCRRHTGAQRVEPPQEAVAGVQRAGGQGLREPVVGQDAPPAPEAAVQRQLADAGLVLGMDEHPAAPVAAAGDRLHAHAVHVDKRVVVAVPLPVGGGADRGHDPFGEHLRQRAAEHTQQCEAEPVHPDVVVFPVGARRLQRPQIALPAAPLGGQVAAAVDDVGLAEQRALPFRGLLQQVPPGDRAVVLALEAAIAHPVAHPRVQVGDQPICMGDAGQQGQVGFGDAEGRVHLARVAPARDNVTVAEDQAVRRAARADRADHRVVGRRLEIAGLQMGAQIAREGRLVRRGEGGRFIQGAVQGHGSLCHYSGGLWLALHAAHTAAGGVARRGHRVPKKGGRGDRIWTRRAAGRAAEKFAVPGDDPAGTGRDREIRRRAALPARHGHFPEGRRGILADGGAVGTGEDQLGLRRGQGGDPEPYQPGRDLRRDRPAGWQAAQRGCHGGGGYAAAGGGTAAFPALRAQERRPVSAPVDGAVRPAAPHQPGAWRSSPCSTCRRGWRGCC